MRCCCWQGRIETRGGFVPNETNFPRRSMRPLVSSNQQKRTFCSIGRKLLRLLLKRIKQLMADRFGQHIRAWDLGCEVMFDSLLGLMPHSTVQVVDRGPHWGTSSVPPPRSRPAQDNIWVCDSWDIPPTDQPSLLSIAARTVGVSVSPFQNV
ncbi:hypothetical protein BDZ45DRAFT_479107 [Acephala macrosclerotiorum]|nr:hypothetical protein BDZ45DRAFT_479107 [Acephala macrosclerotiorum]